MDSVNEHEGRSGNQGGSGDGEDPGPDDASGDAPADCGKTIDGADAHDGAGDGVRGADGDAGQGGAEQSDGAGAFGTESAERFQLGDLLSHGVDDAPSAEVGAGGDGGVGGQDDGPVEASPVGEHVGLGHESGGVESAGDNSHCFLRVIATVAERVGSGGKQLEFAKPFVHGLRRLVLKNPMGGNHEDQAEDHAHDGGNDDKDESFVPPFRNDDGEHGSGAGVNGGMHHRGAGISADQRMGGGSGQSPPPGKKVPDDGAKQSGHDDVFIDMIEANHALADGLGDGGAKEKSGEKVECGGPEHSEPGREDAGGNHSRDTVGGIVKAVEEVEDQRYENGDQDKDEVFIHVSTFQGFQVSKFQGLTLQACGMSEVSFLKPLKHCSLETCR